LNALYYSDQTLDYLIKKLEKENLMDNTLLFLFADHGEAFFQHPRNTLHALYLYEENVHVPFLIYNQHFFKKPVTYQGISRHVDIVPTLLDILGIPQVPEYQGVPLLSAHGKQLALLHTHWADDYLGVRDDRWKYIIRMKDQREELYDLSLDKEEKNNLIKEYPGKRYQFQQYVLKAREFKKQFFNKINVLPIKGKKSPTN
jgi:arylsulfatase A-like enzyme